MQPLPGFGGALTAGTWNALDGSTLVFPSGTSITTNQANVTLERTGRDHRGPERPDVE